VNIGLEARLGDLICGVVARSHEIVMPNKPRLEVRECYGAAVSLQDQTSSMCGNTTVDKIEKRAIGMYIIGFTF
jgi:hypothetical protein